MYIRKMKSCSLQTYFMQRSSKQAEISGNYREKLSRRLTAFKSLSTERQDMFKSTLARFNRIYASITQVCRLFDKDIHNFSVYAKFLLMQLPKGSTERVSVDDKVLLKYYRLEKDFEGSIDLEPAEESFRPITGEAGRKDKKKSPLTVIIDKINERYGTDFTEMDKVLLQIESDYEAQDKWHGYAQNNNLKSAVPAFNSCLCPPVIWIDMINWFRR